MSYIFYKCKMNVQRIMPEWISRAVKVYTTRDLIHLDKNKCPNSILYPLKVIPPIFVHFCQKAFL